jgi:hypothetical protein
MAHSTMVNLLVKVTFMNLLQTKLDLKMSYSLVIQMLLDIFTMSTYLADNVCMQ